MLILLINAWSCCKMHCVNSTTSTEWYTFSTSIKLCSSSFGESILLCGRFLLTVFVRGEELLKWHFSHEHGRVICLSHTYVFICVTFLYCHRKLYYYICKYIAVTPQRNSNLINPNQNVIYYFKHIALNKNYIMSNNISLNVSRYFVDVYF